MSASKDVAALLRVAAAGRREYQANAHPDDVATLETEAVTLEQAALVVEGDLEPMRGWLPSWRWASVLDSEGTDHG